jgi:amino acid adenylation domain-containing protein
MSDDDSRQSLLRVLAYRQAFDDRLGQVEQQTPFDSVYDVDTAEPVELWDLPEADARMVGRNARYSPTPVRTVRNALRKCDVRHEETTFVDVGCGKGRILLLAAELPFRRIVGVEASETLCDVARNNVKTASESLDGWNRIDVVHADATQFTIPDDAGLFYFYEPFSTDVSSVVLERIEESIRRKPRRVVLCFTGRGQPDGQGSEPETSPVAAAAAEMRPQWNLIEVVSSPDAEFWDSFLYEHVDPGSPAVHERSGLNEATSLPDLFRKVATVRGSAPALRDNGRTLSYHELDVLSDQLAARIARDGVRPGDRIGLLLHRSIELSIAILAVLKVGAAYVPLDPTYPAERLRYLTGDAGIRLVVGDSGHVASAGLADVRAVSPDTDGEELPPLPHVDLDGGELAYILYTSGSTGVPKGCMISHNSVLELLRSAVAVFDVSAEDRVTLFHPFTFDLSVFEFWLSMAVGATSVVVPLRTAQSASDLLTLLERESVTMACQVPSSFRALAYAYEEAGRPELALRYVTVGGESVELDVVSAFLEVCRGTRPTVVNLYGPTEATCFATCRVLTEADIDGPVRSPIGAGLPHLIVEVRDEEMAPLPDGEVGELVIAGSGVAVGYLGQPGLTARSFVVLDTPRGPLRYYRTGDLARRLPDGSFEYLGRNDQQVKVRGVRVELGEVEAFLRAHELVRDAAATVVTTEVGAKFLVACVVLADQAPGEPKSLLRQHMLESVPPFMVPDRYQLVRELPLTPSGKLDRRAVTDIATPHRTRRP